MKHGNWNVMPTADRFATDPRREEHPQRPDHLTRIFTTARKMINALNDADLAAADRTLVIQIVTAAYKRVEE